jgi:hypothetical protein
MPVIFTAGRHLQEPISTPKNGTCKVEFYILYFWRGPFWVLHSPSKPKFCWGHPMGQKHE